jgi:hypothetical protein
MLTFLSHLFPRLFQFKMALNLEKQLLFVSSYLKQDQKPMTDYDLVRGLP